MDFLKGLYNRITGRTVDVEEIAKANVYVTDELPHNVVDVFERDIWITTDHANVYVLEDGLWNVVVHKGRKYE